MLSALATGTLVRVPKTGTAASGTRWANGIMRVPCGQSKEGDQESAFITVVCFGGHADRLAKLDKGDSISVQGSMKPTEYVKDGETRHGLEIVAQAVLSAYDLKKKRGSDDAKPDKPKAGADGWQVYEKPDRRDYDDRLNF